MRNENALSSRDLSFVSESSPLFFQKTNTSLLLVIFHYIGTRNMKILGVPYENCKNMRNIKVANSIRTFILAVTFSTSDYLN